MSEPLTILKKPNGKSKAITIDYQTQSTIKSFKERYRELLQSEDEIRDIDKLSIQVILNDLDEFDQNILIAYYAIAGGSAATLARVFGVNSSVITNRINKIIKYVRNRVESLSTTVDSGIHC